MDGPIDVDQMWKSLGTWGKFQIGQLAISQIGFIPAAMHFICIVFLAYRPPYVCDEVESTDIFRDMNHLEANVTYRYVYDKCSIDVFTNGTNSTRVQRADCISGFNYGVPKDRTIVTEWDLVCHSAGRAEFTQTLITVGNGIGGLIFTSLSDRYGRKPVHIISHIGLFGLSLGLAWTTNYTTFAILRFFLGFLQMGCSSTLGILALEMLPLKSRFLSEVIGLVFWTTGIALVTPFAYIFRDMSWRYLQMALAIVSTYSLVEYFILEESVRWLLANGKTQEAERIIRKAAKLNNKDFTEVIRAASLKAREMEMFKLDSVPIISVPVPHASVDGGGRGNCDPDNMGDQSNKNGLMEGNTDYAVHPESILPRYSIITIFQHKLILMNSCIVWYTWIVDSLVYYALLLTSASLSGDRYVNFLLMALVEYPAALAEWYFMKTIGRRKTSMLFHFVTGLALAISTASMVYADRSPVFGTVSLVFSLIGKFSITGAYSTLYLYTSELYPTNLRNVGLGLASAAGRVGGMLAPFAGPLADIILWGPGAIFTAMCISTVYFTSLLPETAGHVLPTTIEELKHWYKDNTGHNSRQKPSRRPLS